MPLTGQIALVTGASRGIGAAIAKELAARGAFVVGTSTTEEGARKVQAGLHEAGASGAGEVLDVTSDESVAALLARLQKGAGPPSVLVNNAGLTRDNLLLRMSAGEWSEVLETNLGSIYRMTHACVRHMLKARAGRIISITSVVGALGNAGQANYAAAKAGIVGFTRSLSRELGSRGITVNAVAPGFIDTDMTRALSEDKRAELLAQIPLRRLGEASDVAAAVAFLAGPGAGYITGHTLHVNGGMYMG